MRYVVLIVRLAGVAVVVLYYRYMMKLGTWQMDYWYVSEWALRAATWARRGMNRMRVWLWSQIRYVPDTAVRLAWDYLRDRYRTGAFGEAGT